ncbi:gamete and mating-type specific protein A-like isoform X3 [Daphnia carinata]|uniref:gamete and mating-type specific protein A-like isoform X1 n=1 Tax=Daphnia carinata TaxID=120202 RepID=UPI00257AAAA1|nr:gamete and mating-type specific protein A-like isoform X1 [Daphnia carinata]XP_059353009.1 gamete and mating-type specific protein A-like isoform X2 [Daphnia carinata]XP_059353010.1 gamete and mating-type specific protein A-like isoform X3 [Daphnia carinata]
MKLFVVAAFLAVVAAVPSSYKPEYKAPSYPAPSYPAPKYPTPSYPAPAYPASAYPAPAYPAPAYPAPAYPTPSYNKDNKYADITVTSQSDERNLDGSSQWSYAQSDYTTREESQVQKKMQGVTYDSYGKESYGEVLGNTNKGSSYWISPEGQKFTLTWVADEAGFQPKGDHLPVAPVHEYELPVAAVHIPFNGKGYKIY